MADDDMSEPSINNLKDAPSLDESANSLPSYLSGGTKESPTSLSESISRLLLSSPKSLPPVPDLYSDPFLHSSDHLSVHSDGGAAANGATQSRSSSLTALSSLRHLNRGASFSPGTPLTPASADSGLESSSPMDHNSEASGAMGGAGGGGDSQTTTSASPRSLRRKQRSIAGSIWSDSRSEFDDFGEDMMTMDGDEERTRADSAELASSERAVVILCVPLPKCCLTNHGINYTRISTFLVRNAPCFWCRGRSVDAFSATDRSVLLRLNVLNAVFAAGQILSSFWIGISFYSKSIVKRNDDVVNRDPDFILTPNLWNLNGSIFIAGLTGFILFVTMILTMRTIREVNLGGAIKYMWVLFWTLPMEIMMTISLFDYHRVTQVWVRHWWGVSTMAWFRKQFCKRGTYNTKCLVPIYGGVDFESEEAWCLQNYDSTDCSAIRDSAQKTMLALSIGFYNLNAIWAVLLILLLLLTINVLEGIITKPVVQSSRESNIPTWLMLPTVGCLTVGSVLLFSPGSVVSMRSGNSNTNWIGVLYMISGSCYLICALLGWFISSFSILNSRDKQNKKMAVFLFLGFGAVSVIFMTTIFTSSIILSTNLLNRFPNFNGVSGDIACIIDTVESCSNCYGEKPGEPKCPEWTTDEVLRVMQTQLKQSATMAAIFLLYSVNALRFGVVLRKHISMYQIDYV